MYKRQDLDAGLIRCVGNPDRRFQEDALRLLRAVRFAAQLDFTLENSTAAALHRNAGRLDLVSGERVKAELEKILLLSLIHILDVYKRQRMHLS